MLDKHCSPRTMTVRQNNITSYDKNNFLKIIMWNRDRKKKEKKQDPACCYQMLTILKNKGQTGQQGLPF